MRNIFILRIAFAFSLLSLPGCDHYDFPESPYARVTTNPVLNISQSGAHFVGNLVKLDSKPITQHGFVWGLTENISIKSLDTIVLGSLTVTGEFSADVDDLDAGTQYYVKSFVYTGEYYIYGDPVSFIAK